MKSDLLGIVTRYRQHLQQLDEWFAGCAEAFPETIVCGGGCSGCCRGLFDITMLDAALLQTGFETLPAPVRESVLEKARSSLAALSAVRADFAAPWILNSYPEEEWEEMMPDDDETPCVLLSGSGECLVYACRPTTCRLHGIPMIEPDGEVTFDEYCTLNFNGKDPLAMPELRFDFRALFTREQKLFREFTARLAGETVNELDTIIPAAVMIDFDRFGEAAWKKGF